MLAKALTAALDKLVADLPFTLSAAPVATSNSITIVLNLLSLQAPPALPTDDNAAVGNAVVTPPRPVTLLRGRFAGFDARDIEIKIGAPSINTLYE